MLRLPWASKTQATRSPIGDATRSDGNGELKTCSRVNPLFCRAEEREVLTAKPASKTNDEARRNRASRRAVFMVILFQSRFEDCLSTNATVGLNLLGETIIHLAPENEGERGYKNFIPRFARPSRPPVQGTPTHKSLASNEDGRDPAACNLCLFQHSGEIL